MAPLAGGAAAVEIECNATGPAVALLIIAGTRNTWELLIRAREHDAT